MTKPLVNFVDGLVGSGKTHSMIEFIVASGEAEHFLIGTPNTNLSREIEKKLAQKGIDCVQIDSENSRRCAPAVRDLLIQKTHKVIIANRDVILKMDRKFTGKHHLILDEVPDVYDSVTLEGIVISKNAIKRLFTTTTTKENPDYYDVQITDEGADFLAKYRNEKVLIVNEVEKKSSLSNVLETAWGNNFRTIISANSWMNFMEGDGKRLTFFVLLKASVFTGFKSLTIMGANFTDRLFYLVLSSEIDFVPHPVIKGRYYDHSHKADQTTIYYFSKRNCTKGLLGLIGYQGFFDRAAEEVDRLCPNFPHIYTLNNPEKVKGVVQAPYNWLSANGKYISPDPLGWDGLKDRNVAVHLAALNYATMDFSFFANFLLVSAEEATRSMTFERIYQFVGRTSFRDIESDEPVTFFVFDQRQAFWLQKLICCPMPTFIDLGYEELREEKAAPISGSARVARWRADEAKKERLEQDMETIQYEGYGSRIWSTSLDKEPSIASYDLDEVAELFQCAGSIEKKFKRDCSQFREGSFRDPSNPLIADNLISSKIMVLDFDDAVTSPSETSSYLSSRGMTHLIYQSFSHKGYPYNFHALIFMDRAVNAKNYRHIFKILKGDILARFQEENPKAIDKTGASINNWIFMPVKSKWGADVFIPKLVWKDVMARQFALLDVREYLERQFIEKEPTEISDFPIAINETPDADAIVDEFIADATPGNRDYAFKCAGMALNKTKLSDQDKIRALTAKAHHFGKGGDRGAANRLMKSLPRLHSTSV
ncbi:hypothetical protein HW571_18230 [Agrobacterium genomosp. 3]|uniref:hypothetical protein n=1 Tax=Agrobacterium tomkonis TaxID=1183410 RepID=UPI001CD8E25C|nr:hypothetical protein [Agrobacterium tomkonis]MCA1877975.1 hypothetical protein [Agrobacterium tumefaciens]MCA1893200.1 hypothetical protein [Agrobacterium tomkonis]